MLVYLDNCCFNRPFDDLSVETIRLEAEAKLLIQNLILNEKLKLAWSFILTLENLENPDELKRTEISYWRKVASHYAAASPPVERRGRDFEVTGIKAKDAAHLACALEVDVRFFITTDRKLIKKAAGLIDPMEIINPVDFVAILEGMYEK